MVIAFFSILVILFIILVIVTYYNLHGSIWQLDQQQVHGVERYMSLFQRRVVKAPRKILNTPQLLVIHGRSVTEVKESNVKHQIPC